MRQQKQVSLQMEDYFLQDKLKYVENKLKNFKFVSHSENENFFI
jgi:hypothetical protein